MKEHRFDMTTAYTMGIFVLFLAGFLLLVLFGASIYGQTVDRQRENNSQRALLSYLAVTVRNHDHQGAVSVETGADGDVLVLTDEIGGASYATRIYLQDGALVEAYEKAGTNAAQLQTIGDCGAFSIERLGEDTLRIRLDTGTVLLHLRSGPGGAS